MAAEKTTPKDTSAPQASNSGPTRQSLAAQVGRFKENVPLGYGGKVDAGGWDKAIRSDAGKKTC